MRSLAGAARVAKLFCPVAGSIWIALDAGVVTWTSLPRMPVSQCGLDFIAGGVDVLRGEPEPAALKHWWRVARGRGDVERARAPRGPVRVTRSCARNCAGLHSLQVTSTKNVRDLPRLRTLTPTLCAPR